MRNSDSKEIHEMGVATVAISVAISAVFFIFLTLKDVNSGAAGLLSLAGAFSFFCVVFPLRYKKIKSKREKKELGIMP